MSLLTIKQPRPHQCRSILGQQVFCFITIIDTARPNFGEQALGNVNRFDFTQRINPANEMPILAILSSVQRLPSVYSIAIATVA